MAAYLLRFSTPHLLVSSVKSMCLDGPPGLNGESDGMRGDLASHTDCSKNYWAESVAVGASDVMSKSNSSNRSWGRN